MLTQTRITWAFRIFFLAIALLLIVQGEYALALLPLLVAPGIGWQPGASKPESK